MGRKWPLWMLGGAVCLFFCLTLAGTAVKLIYGNRIAPGVELYGQSLFGLSPEEAQKLLTTMQPEVRLELVGIVLPEYQEETEKRIAQILRESHDGIEIMTEANKLHILVKDSMVKLQTEQTMECILNCSREVKVWEWLYAKLFQTPFCVRRVVPEFTWRERYFSEVLELCADVLEREATEAVLRWDNGTIMVSNSSRGFAVDKPATYIEAENVFAEAIVKCGSEKTERITIRMFVSGKVTAPKLTTETAKRCDTRLAEFTTKYTGAGEGRAMNIAAGAAHLHGKVILSGEEFSTAEALMPFTEANGYAAGGTFINGELSESIGGGVCQLSTTLYNALLRTGLTVTKRFPHSLPVGYIMLGQDAAIAGDYKDLCFINNTDAPVLLLCEATGETVKVTLYGDRKAVREGVCIESIVTEKTKDSVTVEVYRREENGGGAVRRELISVNRYRTGSGG